MSRTPEAKARRHAQRRERASQPERAPAPVVASEPVEPVKPAGTVGYVRTVHCRGCYAELVDGRGSRSSGMCWACRPPEHQGRRRRRGLPGRRDQVTLDDAGWPV